MGDGAARTEAAQNRFANAIARAYGVDMAAVGARDQSYLDLSRACVAGLCREPAAQYSRSVAAEAVLGSLVPMGSAAAVDRRHTT